MANLKSKAFKQNKPLTDQFAEEANKEIDAYERVIKERLANVEKIHLQRVTEEAFQDFITLQKILYLSSKTYSIKDKSLLQKI